jgi:hypothetical protein
VPMASSSQDDDAMMRQREPMTIDGLKRSTDRHFHRLDQRFRGRFDRIDQRLTKMDQRFTKIDQRFTKIDQRFDRLEQEMNRSAEETRRQFNIIAESMRDDLRIFADAIAGHSERLKQHDTRIGRLERRL